MVWTTTWGQTSAEGPPPADDHLEQRRLRTAVPTARAHEGRRWQAGRSGDNFAKVFTAHLSEHLRAEPGPTGWARLEASRRLEVYCFNRSNARPKRERSVAPSTAGTIGDGRPRTPSPRRLAVGDPAGLGHGERRSEGADRLRASSADAGWPPRTGLPRPAASTGPRPSRSAGEGAQQSTCSSTLCSGEEWSSHRRRGIL